LASERILRLRRGKGEAWVAKRARPFFLLLLLNRYIVDDAGTASVECFFLGDDDAFGRVPPTNSPKHLVSAPKDEVNARIATIFKG
jgi:hypothetical protein